MTLSEVKTTTSSEEILLLGLLVRIKAEAAVERLAPLIADSDRVDEIYFLLLEQRFLEHLEANEVMPAVTLLRNRITPMQRNTERVHTLASCLMCRTSAELRAQAGGWTGKDSGSRVQLINRIQTYIPAQTMLPPRRLEVLIDEAVRAQLSSCIFHNPLPGAPMDLNNISLLQHHSCGMRDFPAFCVQTLDQRDSELWLCQFSPDGSYLAAGGKDANVDIWRADPVRHTVSFFRVLNTPAYIGCLCWSPDSKKLAACCGEEQSSVLVFEVCTGHQLCSQKVNEEDTYSTAAFFADSRKLAFGGLKGIFYVMDTEDQGRILASVEGYRVQSMAAILPPTRSARSDTQASTTPNPSDMVAPGAPDSITLTDCAMNGGSGAGVEGTLSTDTTDHVDHLLIADSLHRIRLFRFGFLVSASAGGPNQSGGSAPDSGDVITGGTGVASELGTNPNPSSTTNLASSLGPSVTSVPVNCLLHVYIIRLVPNVAGILLDMPILPVGLSRLSSTQSQSSQTPPSLRPVLQHSGSGALSAAPYAVVSSASGSSLTGTGGGGGGSAGGGNSVTILFGAPLERSASANYSAEMRALTAAATAAALAGSHSRSFAGLVHSLSSMVAASSASPADPSGEASVGRPLASTAEASMSPIVCTTSTGTTGTLSGAAGAGHLTSAASTASVVTSSVTSTAAFTPSSLGAQTGNNATNSSYGLLDHRTLFKESHAVQSIVMSRSGQLALITVHKMGLHLWDVEACAIIQRFIGYKQDTFRLHSTFGGATDDFVATGSESYVLGSGQPMEQST
ncbi:WD repeat-containing protein 26 [Fasciola hepatica]|uniref:WD repeat-containing protein 26 n=1 Tax=Fasciola hepatica TaxID=6192 RepID=A0A4E0RK22_FASHE|nr:WD repeat-containing protein 26 [Fasciola hepatica]